MDALMDGWLMGLPAFASLASALFVLAAVRCHPISRLLHEVIGKPQGVTTSLTFKRLPCQGLMDLMLGKE